jgi:hypothetical protein
MRATCYYVAQEPLDKDTLGELASQALRANGLVIRALD